jgi:formate/nitrite transporter
MSQPILNISETAAYIVDSGKVRIKKNITALLLQGFLAGVYIALGAIGYFKVAAHAADPGVGIFLAASIFPTGIIAILLFGAELFTSDCMMIMGTYTKTYRLLPVLRTLALVWIANMLGMVFASGLTSLSGIFTPEMIAKVSDMAEIKTTMPPLQILFSGILCNIIVCTAVWLAYAMKNVMAKITALWFVVTIFVLSGTEHVVANMYFLVAAYFFGANVTVGGIFYNLLLTTVGNFIGGALIVTGINRTIVAKLDRTRARS